MQHQFWLVAYSSHSVFINLQVVLVAQFLLVVPVNLKDPTCIIVTLYLGLVGKSDKVQNYYLSYSTHWNSSLSRWPRVSWVSLSYIEYQSQYFMHEYRRMRPLQEV